MLPLDTILGQLDIFEVYEYFDGPRLFAARNNIGEAFLVFWVDEKENATGWLYLPISDEKLSKLRRKVISLNVAFRKPETSYFLVYTGAPPFRDEVKLLTIDEIDKDFFPPEDCFIEYVNVINKKTDGWSFETVLKGKESPSAEVLSQFIGRFRELVESIMNNLSDEFSQQKFLQLYPQSALPGSIRIKFRTDSDSYTIKSLKIVDQILHVNTKEELRHLLIEHKIGTSQLKDFFSSILRNQLNVEITPKIAADGEVIELRTDSVRRCIEYLTDISIVFIDSIKVPQANDIDKVIEVAKLIDNGIPLLPNSINELTTARQMKYYADAAIAFDLVTKDMQLTTTGKFLISRPERIDQYEILADRFESTDFGWAWMIWAGVKYMTELLPASAEDFLLNSVPVLSKNTAHRRASTLEHWLTKLQPHHRKYKTEQGNK